MYQYSGGVAPAHVALPLLLLRCGNERQQRDQGQKKGFFHGIKGLMFFCVIVILLQCKDIKKNIVSATEKQKSQYF